ncbi:unnamed protein product [Durusdinium trenchii]|uniref:Prolyl 4-hydroxylase alpha subunit Fe(2+) 2OG dioxygenase domain-containing protein n=1 Tax=Durusdinium trenchii TaxID=1381693 RepID=A0ABP0PMA3_9DINO
MEPSIFVSIPSYRDPECQYTICDLFAKAAVPERVFIGVCWQADRAEDECCFWLEPPSHLRSNVRVLWLMPRDARGPCYARARIQQELYQAEDYYLQLDSHYRLIPDWDLELLKQLEMCSSPKPILSTYPSSYTLPEDYAPGGPDQATLGEAKGPIVLCAREFGADGFLRITGKRCRPSARPRAGLFWAAGFAFSSGEVVKDVPYDIQLEDLFFGEESSMAVRLWTAGWDFYAPTQVIGFHLWTRTHRPHFREHHSEERQSRQRASMDRVRQQLQGGSLVSGQRSLQDYEAFAGLSFASQSLTDRATLGGLSPEDFEVEPTPSRPSRSPYPQGLLPSNVAQTLQAMLGQEPSSAPAMLVAPLAPQPPRVLRAADSPVGRWLRVEEVEELNLSGICILDHFLTERCFGEASGAVDPTQAPALVRRGARAYQALRPARLGGESVWRSQEVRGDEMAWLTVGHGGFPEALEALRQAQVSAEPSEQDLQVALHMLSALRREMDEAYGLESSRASCMLARYPGAGARYARHRDALHQGERGTARRLTAVYYLNSGWETEHGGCLRAHLPHAAGARLKAAAPTTKTMDTTEGAQKAAMSWSCWSARLGWWPFVRRWPCLRSADWDEDWSGLSSSETESDPLEAVHQLRREQVRRQSHAQQLGHVPVQELESIDAVLGTCMGTRSTGTYVDCTFGRGGHARSLLQRLTPCSRLWAFDVDAQAVQVARQLEAEDPRFRILHRPFGEIAEALAQVGQVDGVLMDLGVSNNQAEDSRLQEGMPLDLRMNPSHGISASEWLQQVTEEELAWVIHTYGEEDQVMAERIASKVLRTQRHRGAYRSTYELAEVVKQVKLESCPREVNLGKYANKVNPGKKTINALRVFLNREIEQLEEGLKGAMKLLRIGGRCAILTFTVRERRAVHEFLRQWEDPPLEEQEELSPQRLAELYPLSTTPCPYSVQRLDAPRGPGGAEVAQQPRARSSVLVVLQKSRRTCPLPEGEITPRPVAERFKEPRGTPRLRGA